MTYVKRATCVVLLLSINFGANAFAAELTPDEVAMVVGTVVVSQQVCGPITSKFPLNVAVAKLGQDLVDFQPDGRYAPLVSVKMKKAFEFVSTQGKAAACDAFRFVMKKFLPDIVGN